MFAEGENTLKINKLDAIISDYRGREIRPIPQRVKNPDTNNNWGRSIFKLSNSRIRIQISCWNPKSIS